MLQKGKEKESNEREKEDDRKEKKREEFSKSPKHNSCPRPNSKDRKSEELKTRISDNEAKNDVKISASL